MEFHSFAPAAVLGKNIWGGAAWPLIIWEATAAKRNYYKTNYIKHVEKLDLNYPDKNLGGLSKIWGACAPPGPNVELQLRIRRFH